MKVGPVEIDVPPTQEYLVGICWDGSSEKNPVVLTTPTVTQYTGCGRPCFSATSNLYVGHHYLSITIYTEGQPQTYGPFGFDSQNVPVCITFGDPEPACP